MVEDIRADVDKLLSERRHRPLLYGVRQREGVREITEVIGQRMKQEPDGIVAELGNRCSRGETQIDESVNGDV